MVKWIFMAMMVSVSAAVEPLRINGLVAAVFTPFDSDLELDTSVVPAQWEYLQATNVSWVFVAGTTGESVSLTTEERQALTTAWCGTTANVIVHVGGESVKAAQKLAAHAEQSGAKGIGAMPPSYFKPATVDALAATMGAICGAAPTLPCYYYHIPSKTGVEFPIIDLVKDMADVPNFAGVKYTGLMTSPGYRDLLEILAYDNGKYEVLAGREEMMLSSLAVGVTGHVGSQFNVFGDLYNALQFAAAGGITDANSADLRDRQLQGIAALNAQASSNAALNVHKQFMNYAGVPVGQARLPNLPFTPQEDFQVQANFNAFCAQNPDLYLCRNAGRQASIVVD